MRELLIVLHVLVATSLFFVWVVRYENIVREFQDYCLPDWLRDLVGILKLTCAVLLLFGIGNPRLALFGAAGLAALMVCALATHVRRGTPGTARLPAVSLLILSVVIAMLNGARLGA